MAPKLLAAVAACTIDWRRAGESILVGKRLLKSSVFILPALLLPAAVRSQTVDRRAEATCPVHEVEFGAKSLAVAMDTCTKRYNWTVGELEHIRLMVVVMTRMMGYQLNLKKGGIDAVSIGQILNIFSPAEQDTIGDASAAKSTEMSILVEKILTEVRRMGVKREYHLDACSLIVASAVLNREYKLFVKDHH